MPAMSNWSEGQSDNQTGNERAGGYAAANCKCPPPQSMSQHADGDRPIPTCARVWKKKTL